MDEDSRPITGDTISLNGASLETTEKTIEKSTNKDNLINMTKKPVGLKNFALC